MHESEDSPRSERPKNDISAPGAIVGGALGGSAVGTILAGPIGTVVGALAGAIGGGWVALAGNANEAYSEADDSYYRTHFDQLASRPADRSFENFQPAYQLGHLAARNPDNRQRIWSDLDAELARSWDETMRSTHGSWESVREYARAAYERGATPPHGDPLGSTASASIPSTGSDEPTRASYADPLPVRAHALDPSVVDTQESREQAPPSPGWLKNHDPGAGREESDSK